MKSYIVDTFAGAELIDISPGALMRILLNPDKTCKSCGRKNRERLHIGQNKYKETIMFFCNTCKYGFKI